MRVGPKIRLATATLLLFATASSLPAATLAPGGTSDYRVLLVGDSWAWFMWLDRTLRGVFADNGHPEILEKGDNTTILGSTAAEWADPSSLQLITDELDANPTIDVVQLTVGGNDFLAGQSGGGWYVGMPPGDKAALFARIEADIATIVDHLLAHDPDIRVLVSLYDYPNFVESLVGLLGASCTGYWEDMNEPTPLEINTVMTELIDRADQLLVSRPRGRQSRNLGWMQYLYGYGPFPPGELTPPGDPTLPSPPEAMRFFQADCIHLSGDGHEGIVQHVWDDYYDEAFFGIFGDGFESGDTSAWAGGVP